MLDLNPLPLPSLFEELAADGSLDRLLAAARAEDLGEASAAALGRVLPRLCRAVMQATGATDYNVLQNNGAAAHQAVFYVHFHIIPRFAKAGLGIGWKAGRLADARAAELVGKMRAALA